jgi:hypothetical protein
LSVERSGEIKVAAIELSVRVRLSKVAGEQYPMAPVRNIAFIGVDLPMVKPHQDFAVAVWLEDVFSLDGCRKKREVADTLE